MITRVVTGVFCFFFPVALDSIMHRTFSFLLHLTASCTARQKPTPEIRGRSAFYWLKIVFCRSGFREKGLPRRAIRNQLLLCTHLTIPPTNRRLRCTNRRLRCTNRRLRCITLTRLPLFTQGEAKNSDRQSEGCIVSPFVYERRRSAKRQGVASSLA